MLTAHRASLPAWVCRRLNYLERFQVILAKQVGRQNWTRWPRPHIVPLSWTAASIIVLAMAATGFERKRLDFITTWSRTADPNVFTVEMTPDPRRYEWIEHEGERCL